MESNAFSFFSLPGGTTSPESVDNKGDPIRKRAPHRKSRNGCSECKRKKVKCDEVGPVCGNCSKSKLSCSIRTRLTHSRPRKIITPPRTRSPSPQTFVSSWTVTSAIRPAPIPEIESLMSLMLRRSIQEIELLRHFEKFTSKVLGMSRSLWSTHVLKLALEYDCLMDSIFLIAAAHINHLLPPDHPDRRPLLHLYGKALASLQAAIGKTPTMTTPDFDAFLSSSLLLYHYHWTYIDESASLAASFEETVNLLRGFKHLVMHGQDVAMLGAWSTTLRYSPKVNLERLARETDPKEDLLGDMLFHSFMCGQGSRDPEGSSADNMYAATRLTTVVRAIFICLPNIEESGYESDILRFLFTWPSLCTKSFFEQIRDGNYTSLTLLMTFYASILRVCSEKIWFMKVKALYMYMALRRRLEGKCAKCMRPIYMLYDVALVESYSSMSREDIRSMVPVGTGKRWPSKGY